MTRILLYAYLVLSVFAILVASTTSLTVLHLLPAFLQLVLCFVVFAVGYRARQSRSLPKGPMDRQRPEPSSSAPTFVYVTAGLTALLASVLAAAFYTGKLPGAVLSSMRSADSLYVSYQAYNKELVAGGGTGWLSPYFGLLVYVKLLMLTAVFTIIPRGGPIRGREYVLLLTACGAQAYLGLARATGMEFFELGLALVFAFLLRPRGKKRKGAFVKLAVVATGLALVYSRLLTDRGYTTLSLAAGGDVKLDPNGVGNLLGASVVGFLLKFYDYFGFGFHYVSSYWSAVWLSSGTNAMEGLLPFGYVAAGTDPVALMPQVLDMGPRWHPDSVLIMSWLGLVGLLAICFALGLAGRALENDASLAAITLLYFVLMQMISLPVGNFVWIDRSNAFVVLLFSGILFLRSRGLLAPTFGQFFGLSRSSATHVQARRARTSALQASRARFAAGHETVGGEAQ